MKSALRAARPIQRRERRKHLCRLWGKKTGRRGAASRIRPEEICYGQEGSLSRLLEGNVKTFTFLRRLLKGCGGGDRTFLDQ